MKFFEKCCPCHCMYMNEESHGSSRSTASGKPEAEVVQKKGASAQRIQADPSRRGSLMPNSSSDQNDH